MKVKDLKLILEDFSDDAEVCTVGWDGKKTVKRYAHQCVNFEHQEKVNELWISTEGLLVNAV